MSYNNKYDTSNIENTESFKVKNELLVLGGGCANCHKLMNNTINALAELGRRDNVKLITDYSVITSYGVISLPALVIDGKVVSYGKVLSKDDVKKLISAAGV